MKVLSAELEEDPWAVLVGGHRSGPFPGRVFDLDPEQTENPYTKPILGVYVYTEMPACSLTEGTGAESTKLIEAPGAELTPSQ